MKEHPFQNFLQEFVPLVAKKSKQLNQAYWLLETTGMQDAADLKADLDAELRFLFHDAEVYKKLLIWDQDDTLKDPILKRQLNVLIRTFKQNQIPKALLQEIAEKEAALAQSYASFRPELEGKKVSENDILERLKLEGDVEKRKAAWQASKKIGAILAPQILELVELRNRTAKQLGYSDYFQMQLDLQEVDSQWLLEVFEDLSQKSESGYEKVIEEINQQPITSVGEFKQIVNSLDPNETQVLSVCRHRTRSFVVLRPR